MSATNPGGGLSPETKDILTRAQKNIDASAQIKADVLQTQSVKNKEAEECLNQAESLFCIMECYGALERLRVNSRDSLTLLLYV